MFKNLGICFDKPDDKGGGDSKPNTVNVDGKDMPLDDLSKDQLLKVAADSLEIKRTANAEAKDYREKYESLKSTADKADKEKKEKDMDLSEKLKAREKEVEDLNAKLSSQQIESKAIDHLTGLGFEAKFVRASLPKGLSDDNFKDSMKSFEKDFERYKLPKDDDPANKFGNRQPAPGRKTVKKPQGARSLGQNAVKEIYSGGKKE